MVAAFSVIRKLLVSAQTNIATVGIVYSVEALATASRARTTPPLTMRTCTYKMDAQDASLTWVMTRNWDLCQYSQWKN